MRGGTGSDDSACAKASVDEGRDDRAIERKGEGARGRKSESKLL